jgi:hypothetical protein
MTSLTDIADNRTSSRWRHEAVAPVTAVAVFRRLGRTVADGHEAFVASTGGSFANRDSWLNAALAKGDIPPNTPPWSKCCGV